MTELDRIVVRHSDALADRAEALMAEFCYVEQRMREMGIDPHDPGWAVRRHLAEAARAALDTQLRSMVDVCERALLEMARV